MSDLQALVQDYGKQCPQRVARSQSTMPKRMFKEQDAGYFVDHHEAHMPQFWGLKQWKSKQIWGFTESHNIWGH